MNHAHVAAVKSTSTAVAEINSLNRKVRLTGTAYPVKADYFLMFYFFCPAAHSMHRSFITQLSQSGFLALQQFLP